VASGAWPETFEMPGNAIWRLQNATNHWGGRGSASDPPGGAYSAPPDPVDSKRSIPPYTTHGGIISLKSWTRNAKNEKRMMQTRNEQKKMKETKYGIARSLPQSLVPRLCESSSHSFLDIHDSIICCQLSPVAHLTNVQTINTV